MKFKLLIALCILICTVSCKEKSETIYVGSIMDLSSDNAEYGKNVQKGMDLALEEYRKSHPDCKVNILYEDNAGNASKTLSAYHKMAMKNKPIVVVDGAQSTLSLSLIPKTEKDEVVLLSTGASSPKLTGVSPYFFRLWNCDTEEGCFIAEAIFNTIEIKSVNVLYLNTDYGLGLMNTFKTKYEQLGGKIGTIVAFEDSQTDYKDCVAKIKQTPSDGIYIVGYATESALISKYIRSVGIKNPIFSTVATEADQFVKLAGNAGNGVVYAYTQPTTSKEYQSFRELYKTKYNEDPQILTDVAFDAMNILLKSVDEGNVINGKMLKEYLSSMPEFDGASGNIKFDKDGNVHKGMILKMVKDGKFVDYIKE